MLCSLIDCISKRLVWIKHVGLNTKKRYFHLLHDKQLFSFSQTAIRTTGLIFCSIYKRNDDASNYMSSTVSLLRFLFRSCPSCSFNAAYSWVYWETFPDRYCHIVSIRDNFHSNLLQRGQLPSPLILWRPWPP